MRGVMLQYSVAESRVPATAYFTRLADRTCLATRIAQLVGLMLACGVTSQGVAQQVLSGTVSGVYDFSGQDVTIQNVVVDRFDGRMTAGDHTLESPGVIGDGNSSGMFRVVAK